MPQSPLTRRAVLLAAAAACATPALAQSPKFRPKSQSGGVELDAPYVPTPPDVVDAMLDLAKVSPQDFVIDLGCGDGRILVAAAKRFGARGYGVDIDPARIIEARAIAEAAKVADRIAFEVKDLFEVDLSPASVLTLYLFPHLNDRLQPKIMKEMQPGARVVSHGFPIGKWPPDRYDLVSGRQVYFWIVPARIEGRWELQGPDGRKAIVDIRQRHQLIMGDVQDPAGARVRNARLTGKEIVLTIDWPGRGAFELTGTVKGESMAGMAQRPGGGSGPWFARRIWAAPLP